VVVSGDVTHRGRREELDQFMECFEPLSKTHRLSVVPGNHDRLGEEAGSAFMRDRVEVDEREGLFLVRLDSTGDHNRSALQPHGILDEADHRAVEQALGLAPCDALRVLVVHHHLLPLPEDSFPEWLASRVGLPLSTELSLGRRLLARIRGQCDLVLHGHRHVPGEVTLFGEDPIPLHILNAGSSTLMRQVRVFSHAGRAIPQDPVWVPTTGRRGDATVVAPLALEAA
jgi:3',5'-cyclic AMP phosphodiesterase CpdA